MIRGGILEDSAVADWVGRSWHWSANWTTVPSPAGSRLSGSHSEHFTFLFYDCAFCRLIQELNPTMRNITYDINDLYAYIDSMPDLSCLVFDHGTSQYQPYTKEWIKKRVYQLLKKQAT